MMTWGIVGLCLALIIARPRRIHEAVWAIGGAALLVVTGSMHASDATAAIAAGTNVYLFLIGMMGLAEFARIEGVFDWLAARAVTRARGSKVRLFSLVYIVGIMTTVFLSNDATIVVLTPAVIAAVALTGASPLPYVFACAFVANAASFVLPISNPANLLVFAGHMPALTVWLRWLALPDLVAIVLTYIALRVIFRYDLAGTVATRVSDESLRPPRPIALAILGLGAAVLVGVSSLGGPLGAATMCVAAVAFIVTLCTRSFSAAALVRGINWPIIAFTAALFVLVTAIDRAGFLTATHALFVRTTPFVTGSVLAIATNLINNLPVGMSAGQTIAAMHPPASVAFSALAGINLGPNFSANGSLATILWLAVLRRAGIGVSAWHFSRVGFIATPLALAGALLAIR
jgi:arsenical pump membrane protein